MASQAFVNTDNSTECESLVRRAGSVPAEAASPHPAAQVVNCERLQGVQSWCPANCSTARLLLLHDMHHYKYRLG